MKRLEQLLVEYGIDWLNEQEKSRLLTLLMGMDDDQVDQVMLGLKGRLDISVYADPDFKAGHMRQIRLGLEDGLNVKLYADKKLSVDQMEWSRLALLKGFSILSYAEAITGYKAMNWDQTCSGFKYDEGHAYMHDDELIPLKKGFHFSEDIRNTLPYYGAKLSNFYAEVKGWGRVARVSDGLAVSEIEIVRFLPMEEFVRLIDNKDLTEHYDLYKKDPNLLVESEDWQDRVLATELGLELDQLINDKHWCVREAVAKQGYGLDQLINDEHDFVRTAVVKQRYGLATLVHDKSWYVRIAVAKQGYGLDILINDRSEDVRETVARQGYGLDILINDKNETVRTVARKISNKLSKSL